MSKEPPPFFGNWQNVYLLVIAVLVIQIIAYYILTVKLR
jgi:hypothetical protein